MIVPPAAESPVIAETPAQTRRRFRRAVARSAAEPCTSAIVYALPKAVFLYPTGVAGIVCGTLANVWPSHSSGLAKIFLAVLILNVAVLAFEFPRTTSVTLFAALTALVLGVLLIDSRWFDLGPEASRALGRLRPDANAQFELTAGVGLLLLIGIAAAVARRFDYWEIQSNEMLHRHGALHGAERLPTDGVRISMDVTDIFEHALLKAGRLVVQPKNGAPIVLDNVPGIKERAGQINEVLGHIHVRVVDAHAARPAEKP